MALRGEAWGSAALRVQPGVSQLHAVRLGVLPVQRVWVSHNFMRWASSVYIKTGDGLLVLRSGVSPPPPTLLPTVVCWGVL